MLSLSTLGDYLRKNPDVMENRTSLQGILKDIFPQDRLTVNLLLMGYDEGLLSMVGSDCSEARLTKLANAIVDNYGIREENAAYIIETWLGIVFQEDIPTDFATTLRQQSSGISGQSLGMSGKAHMNANMSAPSAWQNNSCLSVADVREVFFRTKEKMMTRCQIYSSQDMGTWDVVNMRSNRHYSRSLSQMEKRLIVKKLGKGRYQEGDFAYIRTSTDMTMSWGVTYDSIIITDREYWLIPFADIDYAAAGRGFFTDSMTIVLKNGKSYKVNEKQMLSTPLYDNICDLAGFLNVIKDM